MKKASEESVESDSVSIDDVINIVIQAGSLILESGGETYRAEDIIVYTAKSLGARNPSAFVTPTVVMFSCIDEKNRHCASLKRTTLQAVNLRKIAQVNALSRRLERRGRLTNPAQVKNLLDRITKTNGYPRWLIILFAALSSLCFAGMFGGGIREAAAAFVIGGIVRFSLTAVEKLPIKGFIRSLFAGAVISFFGDFALMLGLVSSSIITVTAVLMQVVPGLAMVNAIRDIIAGDLVSGSARLVDACMTAVGLSVGAVFGILIFPDEIFYVQGGLR